MFGISFYLLCTYYSSIILRLSWYFSVPTRCKWVAHDCESHESTWQHTDMDSRDSSPLRPCFAETHWTRRTQRDSAVLIYLLCQGGNPSLCVSCIDLSNFCHFLRNRDSKYCFFSCNRCSLRLKSGHLLIFRATFIFLHRASKALSRAANSFMLVSWSRLLRNIHS